MDAGDLARATAWTAASILAARQVVGAWQLARTLAWLRHRPEDPGPPEPPDVHVIVPVSREQAHVTSMIHWWDRLLTAFPGMSLMIVSTAREEHERGILAVAISLRDRFTAADFPQLAAGELAELDQARVGGRVPVEAAAQILDRTPLTRQVVDELLDGLEHPRIRHVTYPGAGRKAAQINYAARGLPETGYIAIYDVDSRPDLAALTAVHTLLGAQQPPVVQQHALHLPYLAESGMRRAIVRGSALLQTVWTVRREIPYALRHQRFSSEPGTVAHLLAGLSQPVGHGLYLRRDALAEIGGLPETTVLDDVPTGVSLSLRRIPTVSVPYLTTVPAAQTVKEVISQGRRWFCSYLDYPQLFRTLAPVSGGTPAHRALLGAAALYRGASWLGASPVTAVTVAAALAPRSGKSLRAAAISGLLLTVVVPVVMTSGIREKRPNPRVVAGESAELLAAYLLRSIGPWCAVADALRGRHPAAPNAPSSKTHHRDGVGS